MAYLYEQILNVPGLTGSWRDRVAQYYKQLTGKTYTGTKEQGLYMLDQIANKNYAQPKVATAPKPTTPQLSVAEQYTKAITDQANKIAAIPTFQQTLPFYDAWDRVAGQAGQAAASQIDPELMRTYKSQYGDYMSGLTSTGGQRFGRGLAGGGELKAATERSRNAQLQDWLSQYQQGYKSLFYEPASQSWDTARTSGIAPDQTLKQMPTWEDAYSKLSNQYQSASGTPSPLYG